MLLSQTATLNFGAIHLLAISCHKFDLEKMICCLVPFWLVVVVLRVLPNRSRSTKEGCAPFHIWVFWASRSSNLPHGIPYVSSSRTSFQRDSPNSVMVVFSGWHKNLASLGSQPKKKTTQDQLINDYEWHTVTPYSDIPRMERSWVFMVMPSPWHFQHGRAAWNYDDVSKNSFHRSQAQLETTKDVETHCSTMKKT